MVSDALMTLRRPTKASSRALDATPSLRWASACRLATSARRQMIFGTSTRPKPRAKMPAQMPNMVEDASANVAMLSLVIAP